MKNLKLAGTFLLASALGLASCEKSGDEPTTDPETGTETETPIGFSVVEYTPAPGQFINDTKTGGFTGAETTPELARAWADKRLKEGSFISLGTFGGYVVVKFDEKVKARTGGYDFEIKGNAIASSNEPGVVWVMQDSNGNGLADDQWYELKGSETGAATTLQNYSVTYYRPDAPEKDVKWRDSEGNSGSLAYLAAYHSQPYYYPAWIAEDSYTLTGTRLEARNYLDGATWINPAYDWGYVDNRGSDTTDEMKLTVGFKISNAIDSKGNPVQLDHIDFIKVQQSVLAQSGWIGENSCEITAIKATK